MEPLDLLHELLSALASLPSDLPSDLVQVHLDHTRRHGCVSCRFERDAARLDICGCCRESERLGVQGLRTEPTLMTMTLVVRAVGRTVDGLVFIAVGVDPESVEPGDDPRPCIRLIGTDGRADVIEASYPEGVLRRSLIATIFDSAIASGCSIIVSKGNGRYLRSDTDEALAYCGVYELFGV